MDRQRAVRAGLAVLGIVAISVLAVLLVGFSTSIDDIGDWGTVSENETEIITTVTVHNRLPGNTIRTANVSYQLWFNDISMARGTSGQTALSRGPNTLELSTSIRNEKLPAWWVAYVRNNETIDVRIRPRVTTSGRLPVSTRLPARSRTLLADSTPIITAFSTVASTAEGQYTDPTGSIGYRITDGWATWGTVTEQQTVVRFHFIIQNPGRVKLPAEPDNIAVEMRLNGVSLLSGQSDETGLRGSFETIKPGEQTEAVYTVRMNNSLVDEWFQSHVARGERSEIRTELRLVYSVAGFEFTVPKNGPVVNCSFQTAILADRQETSVSCR